MIRLIAPSPQPSPRLNTPWFWLLLLTSFWLVGCSDPDADTKATQAETTEPAQTGQPSLAVSLVQPQAMTWPTLLAANGDIAAWQEVVIGSEISGFRLTAVHADVGDRVRKGQVLAEINADTIQAELRQSEAAVVEAQALLVEASANAQRAQSLKDSGAASSLEIAQYVTGQQTSQARLAAAKARVQADEVRLAQTRIIAPDDGIISARMATVGSLTQNGQELFRMVRDGRLEWRAEVTAAELSQINLGMTAQIQPPDPTAAVVNGTVRSIAPVVDRNTRNGLIYVDIPSNSTLRAGMFAQGHFMLGERAALTLPQSAVLLRDGFAYVFVVDEQQRARQQKVTLGRRMGDQVEVMGIANDVKVVATGVAFLGDGDKVKITQPIPALSSSEHQSTTTPASDPDLTADHSRSVTAGAAQ
ncbi:MAG: efflux RND transporter periplasmic adaptor subunit [Pseudomonadota bacterium]|nr:efflux RND transporter periplasmic adaptor subunit [Pseudomonadota bacterium]